MNQNTLRKEMRNWFKEITDDNQDIEEQIRQLILENKKLVQNINKLFRQQNLSGVKHVISNHIKLKFLNVTCENCHLINVIKKEDTSPQCIGCKQLLTISSKHTASSTRKKCMYCNNDVAPFAKTVCVECYNQVEVEYD